MTDGRDLTPDRKALAVALEIAIAAPLEQKRSTTEAKVPWEMIHRLRARLEEMGVDWRAVREKSGRD